jgi:RNA polymerase sigma-70 factor, ECF subfamily
MEEELRWVRQAKAGQQAAFARLVAAYQRPVYNLCYRMLGDPGEAEEAAQETFLRIYTRLGSYDESRKLSSWILSIGSHHCIDRLRRRRFEYLDIDNLVPVLASNRRDEEPEYAFLAGESEREVQQLLSVLSPEYRTIVILRYWNQLSYVEIADVLGITEPAVKSRLHRARRALAERLLVGRQVNGGLRPVPAPPA